jgi:Big-like domain-containing protein
MKSTFKRSGFSLAVTFLILATLGSNRHIHAQSPLPGGQLPGFTVEFGDCVESIGVTMVSTSRARRYVPNRFILAGEGQPVTPLVVRTARCNNTAMADLKGKTSEIVQIGAMIVPPDFTGDINNYTIWYSTTDEKLTTKLTRVGVNAKLVPTIGYQYQPADNSFVVRVPVPGEPQFTLTGTVQPAPNSAGSFTANWWQETKTGVVKMSTNVPIINTGGANLSLKTERTGSLGQIVGGPSIGFAVTQQFNTFANARMRVDTSASVTISFPSELKWGPQGTPLPTGAQLISPAELAKFAAADDFHFITSTNLKNAAAAEQARIDSAKKLVDGVAAKNPRLRHLVPVAPKESETLKRMGDGNYRLSRGNDHFILHGTDWLYVATASSLIRTTSRANLEADYRSLIDFLPGDQRVDLPRVPALGSLSEAQLSAAHRELLRRVEVFVPNEMLKLPSDKQKPGKEPGKNLEHAVATAVPTPESTQLHFSGTGCRDSDYQYNNFYAKYDWPMKAYTTPVRDQNNRGTCVVHAIVAAMEARVYRTRGIKTNYSEQELFAIAKGIWFPTADAFGDNLHMESVLDELLSSGERIDGESRWLYNRSSHRIEVDHNYKFSCDNYTGFCSDTNHQMKLVCSTGSDPVCGYVMPPEVTFGGVDPLKLTGFVSLWNPFEPENSLGSIRAHLNAGHPVAMDFNADGHFWDAFGQAPSESGATPGPGQVNFPEGNDSSGGHALLIVGYIPNGDIPSDVAANNGYGGGYLIAKNSYGCGGDGGYMYLAYDWVIDQAKNAFAVTHVSTTLAGPEATLSIDKSALDAPGRVHLTVQVNSHAKRVQIYRSPNTHAILDKTLPIGAERTITAHDDFSDSSQNGLYHYVAAVTDQFGNVAKSTVSALRVQIDNTDPQITLTATPNTVLAPGTVVFNAVASDNVGVSKVNFYHGFQLIGTDTTAPYSVSHSVSVGDQGAYPYVAIAFDAAGNMKTSNTVFVTVTIARRER